MKNLVDICHQPVIVESRSDFVRVRIDEPTLTVGASLLLAAKLIREAYASSVRYSAGVDAEYLAKCFRDVGFMATPDTTLGDLIRQLAVDAEDEMESWLANTPQGHIVNSEDEEYERALRARGVLRSHTPNED